jgi:hypothetical protein
MDIEKEINEIKARNKRVEVDKVWETSLLRRGVIIVFTYVSIGFYLTAIKVPQPWLNAIIPSLGFLLSTLTLPFIKNFWLKHIYKRREE